MHVGRIIATALAGLFFGLFVALDLVFFGAIALNSAVFTIVLALGLVLGAVLGWLAARRGAAA